MDGVSGQMRSRCPHRTRGRAASPLLWPKKAEAAPDAAPLYHTNTRVHTHTCSPADTETIMDALGHPKITAPNVTYSLIGEERRGEERRGEERRGEERRGEERRGEERRGEERRGEERRGEEPMLHTKAGFSRCSSTVNCFIKYRQSPLERLHFSARLHKRLPELFWETPISSFHSKEY